MILPSVRRRHQRTPFPVHCLRYSSCATSTSPTSWTVTISPFLLTAPPSPSPVIIPTSTWSKPGCLWPPAQPSPLRCYSDVWETTLIALEQFLALWRLKILWCSYICPVDEISTGLNSGLLDFFLCCDEVSEGEKTNLLTSFLQFVHQIVVGF